jgi:hypothetical protein
VKSRGSAPGGIFKGDRGHNGFDRTLVTALGFGITTSDASQSLVSAELIASLGSPNPISDAAVAHHRSPRKRWVNCIQWREGLYQEVLRLSRDRQLS